MTTGYANSQEALADLRRLVSDVGSGRIGYIAGVPMRAPHIGIDCLTAARSALSFIEQDMAHLLAERDEWLLKFKELQRHCSEKTQVVIPQYDCPAWLHEQLAALDSRLRGVEDHIFEPLGVVDRPRDSDPTKLLTPTEGCRAD